MTWLGLGLAKRKLINLVPVPSARTNRIEPLTWVLLCTYHYQLVILFFNKSYTFAYGSVVLQGYIIHAGFINGELR